jgi:hypothetical protein
LGWHPLRLWRHSKLWLLLRHLWRYELLWLLLRVLSRTIHFILHPIWTLGLVLLSQKLLILLLSLLLIDLPPMFLKRMVSNLQMPIQMLSLLQVQLGLGGLSHWVVPAVWVHWALQMELWGLKLHCCHFWGLLHARWI